MTIIAAVIISLTAVSLAKVHNLALNTLSSNKTAMQAQQYAAAKADFVKLVKYDELTAQNRTEIINSDGYQDEVNIGNETSYPNNNKIKQKLCTINVYKGHEPIPRSTLIVTRLSVEQNSGGVPIGTIIAWPGTAEPTEYGVWLLCNGQSSAAYPKLRSIIGNTVPNLNGRFLEGTTSTPREFKEAGLPNITGTFYHDPYADRYKPTGAFYQWIAHGWKQLFGESGNGGEVYFDASFSSPVYGKSTTVQPRSEERRVGKECRIGCRSRWSPYH